MLIASVAYGNQTEDWTKQLEHPQWKSSELKDENFKSKYINYNFSKLLIPKSDFLGYIGSNYKRIKIYFQSINKIKPDTYYVKGTSITGGNKCNFEGQILIKQIREYKKMHLGCDDEFKDRGFKAQGLLLGEYKFEENRVQKHSGVFTGIMTFYWFVDKNGNIQYDDIEKDYSDPYNNNQYIGEWREYRSNVIKICNWGEYRIPFSGDLDIGAGEFGVDPKYYKQGWEDFSIKRR
jgi:hypothetical protein